MSKPPLNILIAPDSFKDSLSAPQVCNALSKGIQMYSKSFMIHSQPLSDGGEGMMDILVNASTGTIEFADVQDPLLRIREARYGLVDNGKTAIIETAEASGLQLLSDSERSILTTTSIGVGQLIKEALNGGCKKLVIGLGGSATNDAGTGMAYALGVRFLDKNGEDIGIPRGSTLDQIETIDRTGLDARIYSCDITAITDVSNDMCGPNGATVIYGPQKGATKADLSKVEQGMINMEKIYNRDDDYRKLKYPGTGAAGGLGAGVVALLNGKLTSGFTYISEHTNLRKNIRSADLVITGEGKLDHQTLLGKTCAGVLKIAKEESKPIIIVCGIQQLTSKMLNEFGVVGIYALSNDEVSVEQAMANTESLLSKVAKRAISIYCE